MKCAVVLAGFIALAVSATAQSEVVFTVDTLADQLDADVGDGLCVTSANTCSLRAAVMQANRLTVPLTRIVLGSGTYVLARPPSGSNADDSGDLNLLFTSTLDRSIVIQGSSAANTIIDGNQSDAVINSAYGSPTITISDLTIANGVRGIFNQGEMTVSRCVIENNAIGSSGGGIANTGKLTLVASTVRSNYAENGGGGLYAGSDTQTIIRDSTFYANRATYGGGVSSDDVLYVINSTISGNYADINGGGVYVEGGVAWLLNTSIIGNDADHDRDEFGGIGGGIYTANAGATVSVNTLIASNTILDAPIDDDCHGVLIGAGQNLIGNPTGCTVDATFALVSVSSIDPFLRDNGGPTWTHALLAGSEAIDGTVDSVGCVDENSVFLATDQRGAARPAGARCDVGAFEYGSEAPLTDRILADGFDGASPQSP